ncbi:MAG: hypothetical protein ACTSRJ_02405, partial [Candidatus Hodarchaeales archaeon]
MTIRSSVYENDYQILKRVTIRGGDSKLYDQVIDHTQSWGMSMGDLLTHVIQYSKSGDRSKRFLHQHRGRMHPPKKSEFKIEVIENLEELHVSKEDLISAGQNTVYVFLGITNLYFSNDIDSETLLNHVIFTKSCSNVNMGDNIPKLIEQGLVRKKRRYLSTNAVLRDITIRNVSKPDYSEFVAKAKQENKTVGELLNEMLANIAPNFEIRSILHSQKEPEALVVSDLEELTVTKHGLEELGHRKVLFYEIANLSFDDDIPSALFQEKVLGMLKCPNTTKPHNIPSLIWLAR